MVSPHIPDAEILRRLRDGEDSFVERKSFGDWKKDVVKTCVAFANSCSVEGTAGLLFIGVKDDGTIEASHPNLDSLQKTLEGELKEAYPPIPHNTRVVFASSERVLVVIVPGSAYGPHFAGPAYIRNGPITEAASREQFERVIDRRELKVREMLRCRNKLVTMYRIWAVPSNAVGRIAGEGSALVLDCDSFVVKLQVEGSDQYIAFPLESVVLSYDFRRNRRAVEVPQ